ncbi:MAG: hypothetical protein RLZZ458_3540 [Planctomycetota bacterium]
MFSVPVQLHKVQPDSIVRYSKECLNIEQRRRGGELCCPYNCNVWWLSGQTQFAGVRLLSAEKQDAFQADVCAQRLKALGDPQRLRLIQALQYGEMTVSDLAMLLESEVVNISHHLQVLRRAQIVTVRRDGRFMYYSLRSGLLRRRHLDLGCCRLEVPQVAAGS